MGRESQRHWLWLKFYKSWHTTDGDDNIYATYQQLDEHNEKGHDDSNSQLCPAASSSWLQKEKFGLDKGMYIELERIILKNRWPTVLQLQPRKSSFCRMNVTPVALLYLNAMTFNRYRSIYQRARVGLLWLRSRSSALQRTMSSILSVCLMDLESCCVLLGIY